MTNEELRGAEIIVPGSIANLGPGLDTLAVAIQLYLRVCVRGVSAQTHGNLDFHFGMQPPPRQNRIEAAFRLLAADNREFPSLSLEVQSKIPMGSGLGSSAAATIAGFRLYELLFGPQRNERLLTAALQLEGHADNAAASLLGGLAVCCEKHDGSVTAFSLPWPESLCLIVLTPEMALATDESRRALPPSVGRKDAIANMQRVLLLVQSLESGDDSLLTEALRDRIHQPARAALVPGLSATLELSHPYLLGVFLAGAGPSIVALAREGHEEVEKLLSLSYQPTGIPFHTSILRVHTPDALTVASMAISCS
jgi:homoserine kinase